MYYTGPEIMATVMQLQGWRCYFTSNEGEEPMHVYAQKGQSEAKFWLHADQYVVEEEFEHNLTARGRREIRKIVYLHFDEIAGAWYDTFGGRRAF